MSDGFARAPTTARFLIEIDGEELGWFQEVSGLEVSISTEDIEEGGQNSFVHKLPGRMTWPNITLKRGLTQSDNLFAWFRRSSGEGFAANDNSLDRKTAAITLLHGDGTRLRAWNIEDAYPVKWSGPTFATSGAESANEELEIAHHGFRVGDS